MQKRQQCRLLKLSSGQPVFPLRVVERFDSHPRPVKSRMPDSFAFRRTCEDMSNDDLPA